MRSKSLSQNVNNKLIPSIFIGPMPFSRPTVSVKALKGEAVPPFLAGIRNCAAWGHFRTPAKRQYHLLAGVLKCHQAV